MKGPKYNSNYFTYPKPIEGIIVALLMLLFYLSLFRPESVFLDYYGPLGTFGRYMNKNHIGVLQMIRVAAAAAHIGESIYAGFLCRKKRINTLPTILWMIQTLVMGFPSLLQLVAYKPGKKQG
ncbi:transmembrane protein 254-like [Ruditapes philippinarum]|uniref:transmembrane protein 254-like n=1 Tax=Ruditapes philippinarum TaxID=129788 RepID=UPI00295AC900|nr:transmembrane protein 254-like [Ruditapes philippinarum]